MMAMTSRPTNSTATGTIFRARSLGTVSMAASRLANGMTSDLRTGGWAMSWMTALVMTPSVPSEPMNRFIRL